MKLLFLTQYDESGASSWVRVYQFLDDFRRAGVEFQVRPLIKGKGKANAVFAGLTRFAGPAEKFRTLIFVLSRYLRRFFDVLDARRFDCVVVQKDVLPFGLGRALCLLQKNIVFEFDDPIWLPHESVSGKSLIGRSMVAYRKHCLDYILTRAKFVICDTPKMRDYVTTHNPNVLLFSSPVDVSLYSIESTPDAEPHLLWIGSPSTSYLLKEILPAIETLSQSLPGAVKLTLVNIGGLPFESTSLEIKNISWSIENVRKWGAKSRLGLAPGELGDFNQFKYAYKIWIYSALGLPTLASNTGLNPLSLQDGTSGLLYCHGDEADFVAKARELILDLNRARHMGQMAKEWVSEHFDLKAAGPKLVDAIVGRNTS